MNYWHAEGVTAERSADRVVVLDAEGATLSTLSPVGALVWELLPADAATVVERLRETFPAVEPAVLTADAEAFLSALREAGLIVDIDAEG